MTEWVKSANILSNTLSTSSKLRHDKMDCVFVCTSILIQIAILELFLYNIEVYSTQLDWLHQMNLKTSFEQASFGRNKVMTLHLKHHIAKLTFTTTWTKIEAYFRSSPKLVGCLWICHVKIVKKMSYNAFTCMNIKDGKLRNFCP